MRKALLLSVFTGAALFSAAPAATADTAPSGFCVEVEGNGTVIYSGPAGTVYGVDVEYYPGRCTQPAEEAVALLLALIEDTTV